MPKGDAGADVAAGGEHSLAGDGSNTGGLTAVQVVFPPSNSPPVAHAGSDRTVQTARVGPEATEVSRDLTRSDGTPVANGWYLYRMVGEDGSQSPVQRLVVLR